MSPRYEEVSEYLVEVTEQNRFFIKGHNSESKHKTENQWVQQLQKVHLTMKNEQMEQDVRE